MERAKLASATGYVNSLRGGLSLLLLYLTGSGVGKLVMVSGGGQVELGASIFGFFLLSLVLGTGLWSVWRGGIGVAVAGSVLWLLLLTYEADAVRSAVNTNLLFSLVLLSYATRPFVAVADKLVAGEKESVTLQLQRALRWVVRRHALALGISLGITLSLTGLAEILVAVTSSMAGIAVLLLVALGLIFLLGSARHYKEEQ